MTREPIADDLFTWPDDEPALIGGRCGECGRFTFPLRAGCPYCGATSVSRHVVGREGTLWTWTSQGFQPKPPYSGAFVAPWLVGLVEIPGQLRVEGLLVDCDQDDLQFGMRMRLVVVPFRTDGSGAEIVTFAFAPATTPQEATRA